MCTRILYTYMSLHIHVWQNFVTEDKLEKSTHKNYTIIITKVDKQRIMHFEKETKKQKCIHNTYICVYNTYKYKSNVLCKYSHVLYVLITDRKGLRAGRPHDRLRISH